MSKKAEIWGMLTALSMLLFVAVIVPCTMALSEKQITGTIFGLVVIPVFIFLVVAMRGYAKYLGKFCHCCDKDFVGGEKPSRVVVGRSPGQLFVVCVACDRNKS